MTLTPLENTMNNSVDRPLCGHSATKPMKTQTAVNCRLITITLVYFSQLWSRAKNVLNHRFIKNAGWLGTAEITNRVTRLVTAVVLANFLTPVEFGLAAVALTANELIKVLAQNGIGAKIIQCTDEELDSVCHTAYRINWYFCGGLFLLQCLVGWLVAHIYLNAELGYMIAWLATVYLMMPFALVQAYLIQRKNKLHLTAIISSTQISIDNLLTALLAVIGFGFWSIIIPKALVAPIWVIGTLSQQSWKRDVKRPMSNVAGILNYGKKILGAEILKAVRLHSDNLIVATFLGLEAAGIYFFAKNAGLGISLSLISAFNLSMFTHLCEYRESLSCLQREFIKAIKITGFFLVPIILLQATLSNWYVPIIFGEQWRPAIPVLILLCLSAVPRPFGDGASELMRTLGNTGADLKWNIIFSILLLTSLFIAIPWGVEGVAAAVLVVHLLYPLYCRWVVRQYLFKPHAKKQMQTLN